MLLRLLDAVLPPLCLGCNEIVAEPGALCAACWPVFSFIAAPHCSRCGTPFVEPAGPLENSDVQCGPCLRRPPRFRKARAALVYDDESRRLVLVVRESPLSMVHLENMLKLSRLGVVMLPPMPAFYNHPQSIDDLVNHTVVRVLDQFNIPAPFAKRWDGHMHTAAKVIPVGVAAKSGG